MLSYADRFPPRLVPDRKDVAEQVGTDNKYRTNWMADKVSGKDVDVILVVRTSGYSAAIFLKALDPKTAMAR